MTQLSMIETFTHRNMADTSLDAWDTIKPDLTAREAEVFVALVEYLAHTGHHDCTGAELAAWAGMDKCSTRPRLHGLHKAGWVHRTAEGRPSRCGEMRCHGYWPAVPLAAVQRLAR